MSIEPPVIFLGFCNKSRWYFCPFCIFEASDENENRPQTCTLHTTLLPDVTDARFCITPTQPFKLNLANKICAKYFQPHEGICSSQLVHQSKSNYFHFFKFLCVVENSLRPLPFGMTGQLISAKLIGWSESTLLLFVCCSLVINELCKQTNTKMHQSKLFHYGSECVITPHCQSSKSKKHKGTNCGEVGSDWQDKGL